MRNNVPPTDDRSARLRAALSDVLRSCDGDRLARHLGLRSAAAAEALRANEAALDHLVLRVAEGCDGLQAADAAALARTLLKPSLGGVGDA
jgi:hypothetical protein